MKIKGPIKIVGCGLIGTSIAMRLKEENLEVHLSDVNRNNLELSSSLVGIEYKNFSASVQAPAEIIIVATPPGVIFESCRLEFEANPKAIIIDVSGIKSELILKIEEFPDLSKSFVSVHPMAGRERSGPESARSDLFDSRAWIISESRNSSKRAVGFGRELGLLMGSSIFEVNAKVHDSIVATISHLPQILSSALAGSLESEEASYLNLAGQGLRDISRLADSDPSLWTALLSGNSQEVTPKLGDVIERLSDLKRAIENHDESAIFKFLEDGRKGRKLIPGKHGGARRDYTYVPIVIDDRPGGLARIFNECAAIEVNIEDLSMEHSPGQPVGLITLALSESDAIKLQKHLTSRGWLAHAPRK